MWLVPPVRDRGTPRVQFGLSRSTANSISASVGTGSARMKFSLLLLIGFPDSPTLECAPHDLSLGRSSYRKQAVSNCSGLSGQRIFSASCRTTVVRRALALYIVASRQDTMRHYASP